MLNDAALALSQMLDRRFLGVLVKALLLTVLLLGGLIFLLTWTVTFLPAIEFTIPWIGVEAGAPNGLIAAGAFLVLLLLSAVLMFPVAAIFIGLFLEEIADAVEAKHYPSLGPSRRQSLMEGVIGGLKFAMVLIAANLAALLIFMLTFGTAFFIFWLVNGYLLGREYFELVALRRMDEREARALRRKHRMEIWLAGILLAFPLSIPIIGLIAPIAGVAAFVHLFHRKTGLEPVS